MSLQKYGLFIVDDYSHFTQVLFIAHKNEIFDTFKNFAKQVQNEKSINIVSICTAHGEEFENNLFNTFHAKYGIVHTFSIPYTPQQN